MGCGWVGRICADAGVRVSVWQGTRVYACVSGKVYWGTCVVKLRNSHSNRIVRSWFVLRKAGYGIPRIGCFSRFPEAPGYDCALHGKQYQIAISLLHVHTTPVHASASTRSFGAVQPIHSHVTSQFLSPPPLVLPLTPNSTHNMSHVFVEGYTT
jgi:hypothetical protein